MSVAVLSLLIFAVTITLVIWQPRGLSIGWTAIGGALLAYLAHTVTVHDVEAVVRIVWDATLTFVALIVISAVLDESGFFEWAALRMARAAHGNGRRVFVYIIVLGALVSMFFANDGTALILTPIVLEKIRLLRFDARRTIPFIMASGFIADTTSFPLVISNLVNIVSADYFHIGFLHYAIDMFVPNLVSFVTSLAVLYLFFHRDIPDTFDPNLLPPPNHSIASPVMFRWSWFILVALLLGYVATEFWHVPVSVAAGLAAFALLFAGWRTRTVAVRPVVREAPWSIVFFSVGMYVVVYGLHNAGFTRAIGRLLTTSLHGGLFTGTITAGFTAAVLSSTMNNLPSVMIGALSIHSAHLTGLTQQALVYANVIGCDLGPKITPIGSLATLLWLHILARKGIRVSWGHYFRTGIILTVPTLFITLTGTWAWLVWIHK